MEKNNQLGIFTNSIFFVLGFSVVFSLVGVLLQGVLASISFTVQTWLGYIGGVISVKINKNSIFRKRTQT